MSTATKALKSKTINFAIILAVCGAAQANLPAVQEFVSPQLYGWLTMLAGVVVAGLRVVTTKPLADK